MEGRRVYQDLSARSYIISKWNLNGPELIIMMIFAVAKDSEEFT